MKIFTLIEYKWGGHHHPTDRGQDVTDSDIKISSWDERSDDLWAAYIANCWVDQQYKGTYKFDRFTLLIDGIYVSETDSSDIWDFRYLMENDDGSATPEEIAHEKFVNEFWESVKEFKNKLVEQYNEELAEAKARATEARRIHDEKIAKGTEAVERELYEKLKQKYEGN